MRSDGTVVVWGKDAQRRSHQGYDVDWGGSRNFGVMWFVGFEGGAKSVVTFALI